MNVTSTIYLSLLLLISAFGLVKYKKLTVPFKLLAILIPIVFITELYSRLVGSLYFNASPAYHIYALCEYSLLGLIYYFLLRGRALKNIVLISIIAMAVFIPLNALIWQPFKTTFPSNAVLSSQMLYILFAFLLFGQMVFDSSGQVISTAKLIKNSVFWFNIAVLLFAGSILIPLGFVNFYTKHADIKHSFWDYFLHAANIVFYLMLGWAIWLDSRQHYQIAGLNNNQELQSGEILWEEAIYVTLALTALIFTSTYLANVIVAHNLLSIIVWIAGFVIIVFGTLNSSLKRRIKHQQELAKVRAETQEETAKNISYEIHDNIAQVLAYVKLSLTSLAKELKADKKLILTENAGYLAQAIGDLRDLDKKNLTAKRIAELGLLRVLEDEVAKINKGDLLNVAIFVTGQPRPLGEETEMVLFRIFQIAMHNTLEHAQAKNFDVALDYLDNGYIFTLRDDGIGFIPETLQQTDRMGLKSIKKRAALIGAIPTLEAMPGEGCCITIASR